ncbi:bifunctional DNA primase/polymerase [Actinokineospora auranticolor]|uniref:Bifunctional DNA primase/polymerase-like protein n=1 Tax=Actinokineospora auranticolor TaxID=155976 RepID=A0A2S6GKK1_9PSEU|nr:bifunctional DNA primase/polymerase [Actinokineospora auranticolor]PPK65768.1 bifunctional DNA primase/polymerase-like protein [Actinokineospora auranticolor]
MTSLLSAALAAVERGWTVFPLQRNGKLPAFHGRDRCPRTGPCVSGHLEPERRAMGDPEKVRWYWGSERGRDCNVGIATGPSGLCVVDLDIAKADDPPRPAAWDLPGVGDGADVFTVVCQSAGQEVPWDTFTAATPSGGTHLYFTAPEGVELRCTNGDRGRGLGWKVDTRAWGGHVAAPGSTVDGRNYTITYDREPAPLPDWLVARLLPPPAPIAPPLPTRVGESRRDKYVHAAVVAETAKVRDATHDRNATLYGAAIALGRLVAGGALTEDDARTALMSGAARHIGVRRFSEHEAHKTITSGMLAGAKRPRQVA